MIDIERLRLKYETAKQRVSDLETQLDRVQKRIPAHEEALQALQGVAQQVQEKAHKQIAAVVSKCLAAVFDNPYEFKINFIQRRGRTEAELVFVRDGQEVDPKSAAGGGVMDVTSFALRTACLVLSRPQLRRLLVLDEPFKFVSAQYRSAIEQMLTTLSKELDIQFIIISHLEELQIGRVIKL